ncbi:hypothetical protein [Rhodovulum sp. ES.010]|uniref:hypothetical protein n=1 Tax=Rhodovulum sp. ES.010 TaxID=1882821 RepID=UPI0009408D50|nr:hypothetical protein [Rhodovulum sp. ES.010]
MGAHAASADGLTLTQSSQSWEQITGAFTVTEDTRLSFDFAASKAGEIHAIMFANGETLSEATTIQLLGSQAFGMQDYADYEAGSGLRHYDIALGDHFTGSFDRIVFLTDDDAGLGADSTWANVTLQTGTDGAEAGSALDFGALDIAGFQPGSQDMGAHAASADGLTLTQSSQSWEQITGAFTVTEDTRLSFDFAASKAGEIHAIMFANGETLSEATTIQLLGSQAFGMQDYADYEAGSGLRHYDIALGDHFTGSFDRIVFLTDDDAGLGADSTWANVTLQTGTDGAEAGSALDFGALDIAGFQPGSQDMGAHAASADGLTLTQSSQSWEQITGAFTVTEDTRLSFDFAASKAGEIHAIMFANGETLSEATTIQLLGSQAFGMQDYADYEAGSGLRHYDIALGDHFTGSFDRIVFLTDDDAGLGADSTWANVTLQTGTDGAEAGSALDFGALDIAGFQPGSQDMGAHAASADGLTLTQSSQSWEQITGAFTVTEDTRLSFDFAASKAGEIHAIMFANGETLSEATTIQLLGSQAFGMQDYADYEAGSGLRHYDIALGDHFTGSFDRIVFLTDDDAGLGADSTWANVTLQTGTDGGTPQQPGGQEPDPDPVEPPEDPASPVEDPVQPGTPSGDGAGTDGGIQIDGTAVEVISGRVTTLRPEGDAIAGIRILDGPAHGNLTVNPDNSLALVLTETDYTGRLDIRYEVTHADRSTEVVETRLEAVAGPVEGGWGLGDHYMLATDANDEVIVEWGDNHRDVYVSGSDAALSLEEIAEIEGLKPGQINGRWLADHPEYGSSEDTALDSGAGYMLWRTLVSDSYEAPASHWLRLEAGYEYDMRIPLIGMRGESELHPFHITSYGAGEKPVLSNMLQTFGEGSRNLVISDVELGDGLRFIASGENYILENITSRGDIMTIQKVGDFTLRNSEVFDVALETSLTEGRWEPAPNRISGIYTSAVDGLLMENTFFDHNGWADGYDPDLSLDGNQPPSIYNHNVYIAVDNLDLTFRDNISMRAASFGAQIRSGGYVEDNVFLHNNGAVYVAGGPTKGSSSVYAGNYSLYADNVITSGQNLIYGDINGQVTGGMGDYAPLTSHVDNIVAHLANPDDPEELASKTITQPAIYGATKAYYNDTIVYNWAGAGKDKHFQDVNTEGLDRDVLDATTIQNFAATLLGKADATIADLAAHLRASAIEDAFAGKTDAVLITEFFQAGFGLTPEGRLAAEDLRFVPSDLSGGVRWDNRLNWSTEDLPGTVAGDSVDLAGNWVRYAGTTAIEDLDFGAGGRLTVTQGKLEIAGDVETEAAGGTLAIAEAGQVWMNGYGDSDRLEIAVEGGRFANTGAVDGRIDLSISGGQALLATEGARLDLSGDSAIEIRGDAAQVGFEGTAGGPGVLRLEAGSTLRFEAADGGIGSIGEFRSGAQGEAPVDVASGVNFGEAQLQIDLSGLDAGAGRHALISVDEMVGAFDSIDVTGLSDARDAKIVVDYTNDVLMLEVSDEGAGAGRLDLSVRGDAEDARADARLWEALTADFAPLGDDQMPDEVALNDVLLMEF